MQPFVLCVHLRECKLNTLSLQRNIVVLHLAIMVPELCFYFYKTLLYFLHQIVLSVYLWLCSILGV